MKVIILFFTMIQLFCADEGIIQFDHGLSPPSPPSSPVAPPEPPVPNVWFPWFTSSPSQPPTSPEPTTSSSSPLPYYYPSMPSPPEVMWTSQKSYNLEDVLKIDNKLEKFYIKQEQKLSNKLAYLENKIDGIRSLLREIKSITSVDAFD